MKNKIIDLFCGCGGLSMGFEKAGFETKIAIDMWDDAVKTYNHNRSNKVAVCEDVHNWTEEYLDKLVADGDVVGIIGGPPCQGYSTVGTRDVNDPRNHLYTEYCRIVETVKPDFFVIENVKGLLTLSGGAFRDDIHTRFEALGYTVRDKVVNAADYGVPQRRKRVFIIGCLDMITFEQPKPLFSEDGIGLPGYVTVQEAIGSLPVVEDGGGDKVMECEYDNPTLYDKLMTREIDFDTFYEGCKKRMGCF